MPLAIVRLCFAVVVYAVRSIHRHSFVIAVLLAFLGFAHPELLGQSDTEGSIAGTLLDPAGLSIANAQILATNQSNGADYATAANGSGVFRFAGLPPGHYRVEIRLAPYTPYEAEAVLVEVGRTTNLSPRLAIGSLRETIVVKEGVQGLDTSSVAIATNIDEEAVHGLPSNGRRWSDFALLTPTVTPDQQGYGLLSFRGISVLLNNNTMDGADNNQAFFSEERGRSSIGYSTSEASVREFQVNASNYSAEYGRAAGGVVNTVTHSGSNSFHGNSFFYDRDNQVGGAQNPYTQLTTEPLSNEFVSTPFTPLDERKQWGASAGGPLRRNRLFAFLAYDQYRRDFPGISQPGNAAKFFAAPSNDELTVLNERLGTGLDSIALQDYDLVLNELAGETGVVPRSATQLILFPKLDYQPNDQNHFTLQFNHMHWNSPNGAQTQTSVQYGVASFGNSVVRDDWGIARWNLFLTSTKMNDLLFQYGRDFEAQLSTPPSAFEQAFTANPSHTAPQVSLLSSSYGLKIGKPAALDRVAFPDEHRMQVNDVFTAVSGNHVMKAGVDYNHVIDLTQNLYGGGGEYVYDSMTDFVSDLASPNRCGVSSDSYGNLPCYAYFQQALGPSRFTMSTNDYAVFLADEWRLLRRLTLTAGVRYEYEQLPAANPNLVNPALPQTSILPHDRNNFGPRLGIAWDMFGHGNTVFRAGYGIYYGRIINSTISSALVSTGSPKGQLTYRIKPVDPGAPSFPYVFSSSIAGSEKPAAVYFNAHFQNPQIHEAEVSIAQSMGKGREITISGVASLGRELPNFVDTNIDLSSVGNLTYKVKDLSGIGPLSGQYSTHFFTSRLNPNYQQITDIFSGTNSKYEAAIVTLKQRLSHALQLQAHYTYSHASDFNQNETTFADANDMLDPTDFAAEYGPSNFDVRQRVTGFVMARTPWKFSGLEGALLNGYGMAPTLSAQTGLPFSMRTAGSIPAIPYLDTVNRLQELSGLGYSINGSGGDNRIPGIGRNTYRYPGTINTDMRLSKQTQLSEKMKLELIGEVFNLLNHQNVTSIDTTGYFIGNDTTVGSMPTLTYNTNGGLPLFGSVQNANSSPLYRERQLQFGMKLSF
jgi:outer membrane receptor protein involved in Fe transport